MNAGADISQISLDLFLFGLKGLKLLPVCFGLKESSKEPRLKLPDLRTDTFPIIIAITAVIKEHGVVTMHVLLGIASPLVLVSGVLPGGSSFFELEIRITSTVVLSVSGLLMLEFQSAECQVFLVNGNLSG